MNSDDWTAVVTVARLHAPDWLNSSPITTGTAQEVTTVKQYTEKNMMTLTIQYQCQYNNGILQPEPREVKATTFLHEFCANLCDCVCLSVFLCSSAWNKLIYSFTTFQAGRICLPLHHWSSVAHGCRLSATELFRSPLLVSETNHHATSLFTCEFLRPSEVSSFQP